MWRARTTAHIRGRPVEASTLATIAYFITLVVVRAFVTATHGETRDSLLVGGVHIHHLVFGVIAILVAGVLALDEVLRLTRAVLFGIGAALVLDEFALLVFLKDVYWLPAGDPERVRAGGRPARRSPSTPGAAVRSSGT